MIKWILNLYTDSGIVQFFFWFPVLFNTVFYPIHVWKRIQQNRTDLEEKNYTDHITVGDLFKYFFLTVIPVLNCLDLIFHSFPQAWKYVQHRLDWLFGIKLVNKKCDDFKK